MTSVQSINVGLALSDYSGEATTPTTPRAPVIPVSHPAPPVSNAQSAGHTSTTPTTANFSGVNGQRPLPTSPFRNSFSSSSRPPSEHSTETTNKRDSQLSLQSNELEDITMGGESDREGDGGSDGETVDPETGNTSKKKKGQRFFCTDFPPCRLSFTRSEHLARHIRKHTGERPFQCHCSRRFSRLDNLRQHAQTVHVNEEIPGDSLAATGTRFQRQIRTDRVARPGHNRSRASTASSTGSVHRGHGRNLSTSSIGSTTSTISRDDVRRRPAPIIMGNDPSKPRLTLDVLRGQGASTPPGQTSFFRESSEGLSTPTSTTFSTGGHSPGYGSSIGSPASNARTSGYWDNRGRGRRLSVPNGPMPFHSPQSATYGSPYLSPLASSQASTFGGMIAPLVGSPMNVTHALSGREAAEAEMRRRTWHPTPHTYTNYSRPNVISHFARPATSGLIYNQTLDGPHPPYGPPSAGIESQAQRLPGIETFDQAPRRPASPSPPQPARGGSPMQMDAPIPSSGSHHRRGHSSWDMSLHQNLTKLDIRGRSIQHEPQHWAQHLQQPEPRPHVEHHFRSPRLPIIHQEATKRPTREMGSPSPNPNRAKRQGWYAGPPPNPVAPQSRISPGGSISSEGVPKTPTAPALEHQPSIMHSNGLVESIAHHEPTTNERHALPMESSQQTIWPLHGNQSTQQYTQSSEKGMSSLDVLVEAATREEDVASQA